MHRNEFESAKAIVKASSRTDSYIIEEFIEGEEFGAQAFVYRGKVQFILPHGDYVFQGVRVCRSDILRRMH